MSTLRARPWGSGVAAVLPRGWAAVAALPPLPGRWCRCGAPAVLGTPEGWRCAAHPPEWGALLDWTPRHGATGCGNPRCYCGRCDHYAQGPGS